MPCLLPTRLCIRIFERTHDEKPIVRSSSITTQSYYMQRSQLSFEYKPSIALASRIKLYGTTRSFSWSILRGLFHLFGEWYIRLSLPMLHIPFSFSFRSNSTTSSIGVGWVNLNFLRNFCKTSWVLLSSPRSIPSRVSFAYGLWYLLKIAKRFHSLVCLPSFQCLDWHSLPQYW